MYSVLPLCRTQHSNCTAAKDLKSKSREAMQTTYMYSRSRWLASRRNEPGLVMQKLRTVVTLRSKWDRSQTRRSVATPNMLHLRWYSKDPLGNGRLSDFELDELRHSLSRPAESQKQRLVSGNLWLKRSRRDTELLDCRRLGALLITATRALFTA